MARIIGDKQLLLLLLLLQGRSSWTAEESLVLVVRVMAGVGLTAVVRCKG